MPLLLAMLEYQAGLIKEKSTSELLRFTIPHDILTQVHNQPDYLILKQQQKPLRNNQQKHHNKLLYSLLLILLRITHLSYFANV